MRLLLSLALTTLTFSAFAQMSPSNPAADAQNCLDRLPANPEPRDVDRCLVPVDGVNGAEADGIRCTAGFLREGFGSSDRIVGVFAVLESGLSPSNLRELMSRLSFTSGGVPRLDAARATSTLASCVRSKSRGSSLIAAFATIHMSLVEYFTNKGACTSNVPTVGAEGYFRYDLADCAVTASPADIVTLTSGTTMDADARSAQTVAGDAILKTYDLACSAPAANADLCGVLQTSITSSGANRLPRIVAARFFSTLF